MDVLINLILFVLSYSIQVLIFLFECYYLTITFIGWRKNQCQENLHTNKYHRFAAIIPAHNEALVIKQIIDSLKLQKYPKQYYDIFVIADNCTDNTAKIAKFYGAKTLERFNKLLKGKGHALEWAFNKILKSDPAYEAVCVFDADNLISPDFMSEMNRHLNKGHKVIQGYIDSKNPFDTWITCSYSIAFWLSNRIFQEPHYNLGLSCGLCGTGFCIRTDVLKKIGWGATCLTEDLEFTIKLVLNEYKVAYARKAVVFDEKPLRLKQSWKQRKRWMQGHADCAKRYLRLLITKSFKQKSLASFDCAVYLFQPIRFVFFGAATILTWLQSFFPSSPIYIIGYAFPTEIWYSIIILQLLYGPLVLLFEKGFSWKILLGFIIYPFYCLTWLPISIQGIIDMNKKEWCHTIHTRCISIRELKES